MADRPLPPTFTSIVNDVLRRLRDLERQVGLDDFDIPLQTLESGQPLGDTRFLNFGAGLHATLTGDGFVKVDAEVGDTYPWDAVVDGALAASVPAKRLFRGIGEALDWLFNNVPFMNNVESTCAVFVRNGNNAGTGRAIYTETADWDSPSNVLLFGGTVGDVGILGAGDESFDWRPGNFNPVQAAVSYTVYNCGNLAITKTSGGLEWGSMKLVNSVLASTNTSVANRIFDTFEAHGSTITGIPNALGTYVWFDNCYVETGAGTSTPATTGTTSIFVMTGCRLAGTGTVNLPHRFHVDVRGDNATGGFGPMPAFVVPTGGSTVVGYIKVTECISTPPAVTATGAFSKLVLDGDFHTLTLSGAHSSLNVKANRISAGGTWDFTGPADLDLSILDTIGSGGAAVILRGTRIEASIDAAVTGSGANPGSMRTAIRGIGLTHSNLRAALNATGFTVGQLLQPWSFDAASTDNLLIVTGTGTFPDAGTDGGTDNVVGPPFAGSAALAVQVYDESVLQGGASAFDFVGAGVTATEAGGVATITIPGGSGGLVSVIEDPRYRMQVM